jgi:hypothetical protein
VLGGLLHIDRQIRALGLEVPREDFNRKVL